MIDKILLYTTNKYSRGLSVVELLVTILCLIASSIAIPIFLNIKTFYSDSAQRVNTYIKEMTVKQAIYDMYCKLWIIVCI